MSTSKIHKPPNSSHRHDFKNVETFYPVVTRLRYLKLEELPTFNKEPPLLLSDSTFRWKVMWDPFHNYPSKRREKLTSKPASQLRHWSQCAKCVAMPAPASKASIDLYRSTSSKVEPSVMVLFQGLSFETHPSSTSHYEMIEEIK